jgi:phosphoribosylformylglycinamidine synthase
MPDTSNGKAGSRFDALLFGETQGRIVITTNPLDAVKATERAKLLGIKATRLGTVGGETLTVSTPGRELSWPLAELYDLWWNSIARAMC